MTTPDINYFVRAADHMETGLPFPGATPPEPPPPSLLSRAASTTAGLLTFGAKHAASGAAYLGRSAAKAAYSTVTNAFGRVSQTQPTDPSSAAANSPAVSGVLPSTAMTAAPSAPLPSLALSATPSRYIHESFFFCPHTKKIHRLTLEVPVQVNQAASEELKQLNSALDTYKDHFVKHLIEQKESPEIFKSDFNIHFSEGGYTLSSKTPGSATFAITSDEAQRYSNLIRVTERSAMSASLSNPASYAPLPPAATTPPQAASTATVPPTAAPSEVAPPAIAHDTNSCYAAATLWYLHNDPQITADAISKALADSKDSKEQAVLTQLQKQLYTMQQGKSISKEEINAFRDTLIAWKPSDIAKTNKDSGDASATIDFLLNLILKDNYHLFDRAEGKTIENDVQRCLAGLGKDLPNSFEINLDPNAILDAPTTIDAFGVTYKLAKVLCNPNKDHFTTLIRKADEKYYECDDTQGAPKIIDASALKTYKSAVKLRYVLDNGAPATSTQPAAAKAAEPKKIPATQPPTFHLSGGQSLITAIHFLGSNPVIRKELLKCAILNQHLLTLLNGYDEQVDQAKLNQALSALHKALSIEANTSPEQAISKLIAMIPKDNAILMSRATPQFRQPGLVNGIWPKWTKGIAETQFPIIDIPGDATSLKSLFDSSLTQYHSASNLYTQHQYHQAPNVLVFSRSAETPLDQKEGFRKYLPEILGGEDDISTLTLAPNALTDQAAKYFLSSFRTKDATYMSYNNAFWKIDPTTGKAQKILLTEFNEKAKTALGWTYIKDNQTPLNATILLNGNGAILDTVSTTKANTVDLQKGDFEDRWVISSTSDYSQKALDELKDVLAETISKGSSSKTITLVADADTVEAIRNYVKTLVAIKQTGMVTINNLTFEVVKTPSSSGQGEKQFFKKSLTKLLSSDNRSLTINLRSAPLTADQKIPTETYCDDTTASNEQETLDALLAAKPTQKLHLFISEDILLQNYLRIQKAFRPTLREAWNKRSFSAAPLTIQIGGVSKLANSPSSKPAAAKASKKP